MGLLKSKTLLTVYWMPGPATLLDGNKATVKEVLLSFWMFAMTPFV
jgi:hypothetical protein